MIYNNRTTFYIIIAIIFVTFLLRIPILFVRYFDPDEFEHLHAAFSLYHGLIPYRDFFEHHTPLVWFLLAPLYSIFGADIPLLFVARALMLPFTAGILYLTYLLGKRFYNRDVGLLADIRYIMSITSPKDSVLDGWSGFGVFRPHAYYYYFLHKEIRAMLSKEDLEENLILSLKEKRPKVIIYDDSIKALPQAVQDYIAKNYVYSGQGNIYLLQQTSP